MASIRNPTYENTIPKVGVPLLNSLDIQFITDVKQANKVDAVIIAVKSALKTQDDTQAKTPILPKIIEDAVMNTLQTYSQTKKFTGGEGTSIICLSPDNKLTQEIGCLGLGNFSNIQYNILNGYANTAEGQCSATSAAQCQSICVTAAYTAGKTFASMVTSNKLTSAVVSFQTADIDEKGFQRFLEGFMLEMTPDERFKSSETKKPTTNFTKLYIHLMGNDQKQQQDKFSSVINCTKAMIEGIQLAKELCNTPANICTTESLAKEAMSIGKCNNFQCTVLGEKECQSHNMGAYLAVHAGSKFAPQFIHLKYVQGKPQKKIALIGKGITMDTGGYNLKVGCGIETMKTDMAAAAAVLGSAHILSKLNPQNVEVHFIIAAAENMVDNKAIRPGDIVVASNGTKIEIGNTDAEGRLTLADALVYAETVVKPDYIVDCATLTGACMVALGTDIAALYGTDDELVQKILKSANETATPIWPMPMYKPYRKLLDSSIADMNNVSSKRYGGSITAALFLKDFVKKTPWCHIDMAGPATDDSKHLGTGYGAKLLADLVMKL